MNYNERLEKIENEIRFLKTCNLYYAIGMFLLMTLIFMVGAMNI